MLRLRALLAWLLVVGLAGGAGAQQRPPATIVTGVIVDATGAVLPNAQVDLTSATGAAVQSTVADESGTFRFDRVTPGRYDIRAVFDGFEPTLVHITVGNRAVPPVRVTMPIAGISQAVTVGTTSAEVSRNAASNLDASTIDQKGIDNLPVFNQDVLATMSRFLDSSAIGTNGATLVVNGIEVNNLNFSASAIQQIKVNQDPFSAEYPRPGRGRIEVVLKPGSQEYHGTANVIFRDSRLDERNAYATAKPEEQRRIFEGFLSGPVRHSDRTSFMLSAKDNADDMQSIVVAAGVSGPINLNVPSPYRNVLLAGTLNHQRSDNTTMSLTLSYQDQSMKNQGVGGVTLPSAGTNWSFTEESGTYTQQSIIRPTLLNQFRLFVGQEFEPTTSVSADPKVIVLDAFTGGGAQADSLRTEHHFTLTDMVTWSRGGNVLKAGVNIPDWSRRRFDDNTNFGGTFYFSSPADYTAARPYSLIQQVGNGHVAFLEKVVGLFVQDEIHVGPKLSASIGLRYDWQNYFHDANNFGPRGSVAFAPTDDGRTVIRVGAGAFYDRSGPRPIQDILRYDGEQLLKYVITDPSYPNAFASGPPLSAQPAGIVQLAPSIVIPWMLQYSASLEHQLGKATSASVTYIASRGFDQFLSRDINAPPPPLFASRPEPTRGVVRDIESSGKMVGNSLQFTLRGQVSRFVYTQAQYTLSETRNNTSGINWTPPNSYDLSQEYARADFDQRHRFDLLGTINAGSLLTMGASVALYSGRPYSVTTGHDDFNTGIANARPAGVARNSLVGPDYADVDVRLSHDLFFDGARRSGGPVMTFGIDVFNVLNRVNDVAYIGTLTSPFFGQAVAAQPPRRLQLSVRARF